MITENINEDEVLLDEGKDPDDTIKTLADIRKWDAAMADTYYLEECREGWRGACICATCRSYGD